ncbi:MAG: DUF6263 family protein [Flavobacteriales bacterium]
MRNMYFIGLIALVFFSCSDSVKKSTNEKKYSIVFKPTKGEKKEMSYEFTCISPSDSTNVSFMMDLGLEVISTKSQQHEINVSYNKLCSDGNRGSLSMKGCAHDSITPELKKAVSSVFSYLHSVYTMQFDDRMRKTNETVIEVDSALGVVAAPIGKMQFFTVLPASEVKPGDSWKEELDLSGANKKKAKLLYKLEKVKNDVAFISFSGTLTAAGEGFGQEFKMSSNFNGTMEIDIKTGWTLAAERKENVDLFSNGVENLVTFIYRMKLK